MSLNRNEAIGDVTSRWNSPSCELARIQVVQQTEVASSRFKEAADYWLSEHSAYISRRTQSDYRQYISALEKFFSGIILSDIHIGHLREYQKFRRATAGKSRINMELSTLQQILKEARLWEPIGLLYRPLPVSRRGSGQSYTPEQEQRFLDTAFAGGEKWQLAAHCLRLMFRLGVGFGELRMVRRRNLDLPSTFPSITIESDEEYSEGAKNEKRERTIPLIGESLESAQYLLDRWKALGGRTGEDFLIPARRETQTSPVPFHKPIGTIKTAFAAIMKAAGLPKRRIYDARVTCVTKALKSGKVSLHTAKRLFGHVSEEMQTRYYKPELEILRDAVQALDGGPSKKQPEADCVNPPKLHIVR